MGHWYDVEGKACHTQIVKSGPNKGKERNTSLADAKKLGLVPSVTTILGVLSSDGLTDWKIKNALRHAYQLVTDQTAFLFDADGFVEHAYNELSAQSAGYAQAGTDIHAAVEASLLGKNVGEEFAPHIMAFNGCMNELAKGAEVKLIGAESQFAVTDEDFGYGGSMDQHWSIGGIPWVTDLKCKQSTPGKPFYLSDTYPIQMAAYAYAMWRKRAKVEDPMPRIANILLSATEPGRCQVVVYSVEEQSAAIAQFMLLRKLWYMRNWS